MVTCLAVLAMAARFSLDSDTWWHLQSGKLILERKEILREDPFSYTREGAEWKYPGWLAEIALYGVYARLGPGGLNMLTAIMVTGTFVLLWFALKGNHYFRAFLIIIAAAASGVYWAARPYLITFLFSGGFLFILERENRFGVGQISNDSSEESATSNSLIWLLPVLMVIWVNSHGGFVVGFILYGIYFLGLSFEWGIPGIIKETFKDRSWNKFNWLFGDKQSEKTDSLQINRQKYLNRWGVLVLVGILLVVAVVINPAGPEMLLYPFKTVKINALSNYIEEWQSPDFHELRLQPFLLLIVLTLGVIGGSRKQLKLLDYILFSIFVVLGLLAVRNVALFALAAPILISRYGVSWLRFLCRDAEWLQVSQSRKSKLGNVINVFILLLLLAAVGYKLSIVIPEEKNQKYIDQHFPVQAVNVIEEGNYPGRLFNSYNWGGYLIWALPDKPVFVDGRTDLYGDEIIDQWVKVVTAEPGWENILDSWGVNLILLEPDRPVVERLNEGVWEKLFEDQQAVVFLRENVLVEQQE